MLKQSKSKKTFALGSKAVYKKGVERDQYIPEGFSIDNEFTNKKVLTMVNSNTGEVVTAFRGTQGKGDLRQDAAMAFGLNQYNKNYKEGLDISTKVKDKYKNYDYTLTGHSLGGKNAYDISNKLNLKSVTYDTPSSVFDISRVNLLNNNIKPNKKNKLHTTIGDPISLGSYFSNGTKTVSKPKGNYTHAIDNYL
jgi:hypothetical protein